MLKSNRYIPTRFKIVGRTSLVSQSISNKFRKLNKNTFFIIQHCLTEARFLCMYGLLLESSRLGVFLGKGALKICNKFIGEHQCKSMISIKLKNNFVEITLSAWMFSCKFAAYFQNTFT